MSAPIQFDIPKAYVLNSNQARRMPEMPNRLLQPIGRCLMRRFHWSWVPVVLMVALLVMGVVLLVWEAFA